MSLSQVLVLGGIVAYFSMKKQLLKSNSKEYVKSIRATLIVPILQVVLFTFFYEEGSRAAKGASSIDSLHNISTYTPYLGDLGTIADIANQNGLLPDIERSQSMLEYISAAGMATNAVNIGIFIVIALAIAELYGVFNIGKFTKKQMLMFYGSVSVTFVICSIVLGIWQNKLMTVLSIASNANDSNVTIFIFPIFALLMVGIPYIFYKKALDRFFFKHKEEFVTEFTEHNDF